MNRYRGVLTDAQVVSMRGAAHALGFHGADAEDLEQEAAIGVWRSGGTVSPLTVMRRRSVDMLRSRFGRARRERVELGDFDDPDDPDDLNDWRSAPAGDCPVSAAVVRQALQALPGELLEFAESLFDADTPAELRQSTGLDEDAISWRRGRLSTLLAGVLLAPVPRVGKRRA